MHRRDADRVHEKRPAVGRHGIRPRVHGPISAERRRYVAAFVRIAARWRRDARRRSIDRNARNDRVRLVVCGAHLDGLPLNGQLRRAARASSRTTTSAPHYRLHALAANAGETRRPGMERVAQDGAAIEVEVWEMPSVELGSFLAAIPAPLALGKVQLADGSWQTGFVCEGIGLEGATDITRFGGWRAWLAESKGS